MIINKNNVMFASYRDIMEEVAHMNELLETETLKWFIDHYIQRRKMLLDEIERRNEKRKLERQERFDKSLNSKIKISDTNIPTEWKRMNKSRMEKCITTINERFGHVKKEKTTKKEKKVYTNFYLEAQKIELGNFYIGKCCGCDKKDKILSKETGMCSECAEQLSSALNHIKNS